MGGGGGGRMEMGWWCLLYCFVTLSISEGPQIVDPKLNDLKNLNESHKIDHKMSGIIITQESGDISHTNGNGPVNMNFMKWRSCISEPSDLLMFVLIFMAFPWV